MILPEKWVRLADLELLEMLRYWKAKLGITDWAVEVEVVPPNRLDKDVSADCTWMLSRRTACIRIGDAEKEDDTTILHDTEMLLVHELLHAAFGHWHNRIDDAVALTRAEESVMCEQPIDQLAQSLVLLRRSSDLTFSFEEEPS